MHFLAHFVKLRSQTFFDEKIILYVFLHLVVFQLYFSSGVAVINEDAEIFLEKISYLARCKLIQLVYSVRDISCVIVSEVLDYYMFVSSFYFTLYSLIISRLSQHIKFADNIVNFILFV